MRNTVSDVTVDRERMLVTWLAVELLGFTLCCVMCVSLALTLKFGTKRAYRCFVNSFTSKLCQQKPTFNVVEVIDKIRGTSTLHIKISIRVTGEKYSAAFFHLPAREGLTKRNNQVAL